MRRQLRRFCATTVAVTAIDVAVLVGLAALGVPVPLAGAVAVAVAATASWSLHRAVSGDDLPGRWMERPRWFVATTLVAGGLDIAVVTARAGWREPAVATLLASKALALVLAGGVRLVAHRAASFGVTRAVLAERTARPPAPGRVRLSVVIPAYQEEARIAPTVGRVRDALTGVDDDGGLEILVVDDGSTDATSARAAAAGARTVRLSENRGKGAAVRAGMLEATGRTVAFVDADLAYPPAQLLGLLAEVEAGWDVAVGSRRHPGSTSETAVPMIRLLSGRLFNLLTAVVLLGRYRDTQCGLKALRSDVARTVFARTRLDGFAFDVEVFHLVERYRLSLVEVPVTLVEAEGSTVRIGADALTMVRDLFRVRRWAGQGRYDLDAPVTACGREPPN
ncbi:MAG TPA: glycosyltransferase [Acidimicrobiales bacterium]|nr:glycosyltransferase [Acidimicrobiales bacterium]